MGIGRGVVGARTERPVWPPRWFGWAPPALILLSLGIELATPSRLSFSALLTASAVLAALTYRPAVTGAVGVLCIVLLLVVRVAQGEPLSFPTVGSAVTLLLVSALAVVLAAVRVRTTRELSKVQAVAEAVQLALLRPLPERLGPVRLAGFYQPADYAALIGGDLYSVRPTPYGVRALIGDVRGKGLGATETVATVTSVFRAAATECATLSQVAGRIEAAMSLDRADAAAGASRSGPGSDVGSQPAELFATAVLLEFPESPGFPESPEAPAEGGGTRFVRVLDRGHPPLLRVGTGGVAPLEEEHGLPLGLADLAPRQGPASHVQQEPQEEQEPQEDQEPQVFALAAGDALVAYSDGVTEARARDGSFYPLRQRLARRYAAGCGPQGVEPGDLVGYVQQDLAAWTPALNDDAVLVVLKPEAYEAG